MNVTFIPVLSRPLAFAPVHSALFAAAIFQHRNLYRTEHQEGRGANDYIRLRRDGTNFRLPHLPGSQSEVGLGLRARRIHD